MWGTSKFSLVDQSGLITMMGQFLTLLRWDQCCKILKRGQDRDHKLSGKTLVCSGFSCWNDKAGNFSSEGGKLIGKYTMSHMQTFVSLTQHNTPFALDGKVVFPLGMWERDDAFSDSNCEQVEGRQRSFPRGLFKLSLFKLRGNNTLAAQMKTYLWLWVRWAPCWSTQNSQWKLQLLFVCAQRLSQSWPRNKGKSPWAGGSTCNWVESWLRSTAFIQI